MAGRDMVKYVVGLILWLTVAGVMVYQGKLIHSLGAKQKLLSSETNILTRARRESGDRGSVHATVDCINCNTGGTPYVRWGKMNCSGPGTELIYTGLVGGSHYNVHGGGANYLCLSREPQWGHVDDALSDFSPLYGAEFGGDNGPLMINPNGPRVLVDHDVPCAVCLPSLRVSMVMIPGRRECNHGWTQEYRGYLMAGHKAHKGRFEFVCMDEMPDAESSGYRNDNGALFYKVEGVCGSLPCPPYVGGREISCVVCTK